MLTLSLPGIFLKKERQSRPNIRKKVSQSRAFQAPEGTHDKIGGKSKIRKKKAATPVFIWRSL
jgi:hypothetical protein